MLYNNTVIKNKVHSHQMISILSLIRAVLANDANKFNKCSFTGQETGTQHQRYTSFKELTT